MPGTMNLIAVLAALAALAVSPALAPGETNKAGQSNIDAVVKAYLSVQTMLADDKADDVKSELKKMHESAVALSKESSDEKLIEQAKAVAKHADVEPKDLKAAREAFKPLSASVIALVKLAPPTSEATAALFEATCPMAEANWLQASKEVVNPYMGKEMLRCGTVEREIKPTDSGKGQ